MKCDKTSAKIRLIPHWSIKAIFKDIVNLAKSFVNVNFSYVHRVGNVFAHLFAQ